MDFFGGHGSDAIRFTQPSSTVAVSCSSLVSTRMGGMPGPGSRAVPASAVQLSLVQRSQTPQLLLFGILEKVITPHLVSFYSVWGCKAAQLLPVSILQHVYKTIAESSQLTLGVLQAERNVTGQICSLPAALSVSLLISISWRMKALKYLTLLHDIGSAFRIRLWAVNIC